MVVIAWGGQQREIKKISDTSKQKVYKYYGFTGLRSKRLQTDRLHV